MVPRLQSTQAYLLVAYAVVLLYTTKKCYEVAVDADNLVMSSLLHPNATVRDIVYLLMWLSVDSPLR